MSGERDMGPILFNALRVFLKSIRSTTWNIHLKELFIKYNRIYNLVNSPLIYFSYIYIYIYIY